MEHFKTRQLEDIGKYLRKKKQTIAVAESVTSGLLQFALSTIPLAATFYQGGLTAYNLGQKVRHLQVEPVHAQEVDCVSAKVAKEMALAASLEFTSDWSVAITGYATPVPESGNKLFAYYAIAFKGRVKASGKINLRQLPPMDVQVMYVNRIIEKLAGLMK